MAEGLEGSRARAGPSQQGGAQSGEHSEEPFQENWEALLLGDVFFPLLFFFFFFTIQKGL